MEANTYYTASASSTTTAAAGAHTKPTRSRLNRDQTIASNALFFVSFLLCLFIMFWCTHIPTVGFYFVLTLNVLLFVLNYWMWTGAKKWFPVPRPRVIQDSIPRNDD